MRPQLTLATQQDETNMRASRSLARRNHHLQPTPAGSTDWNSWQVLSGSNPECKTFVHFTTSLFRAVILSAAKNLTARPFTSFRVTTLLYQSHAVWFSVLPEQFFNSQASFFTGRPVAALLRAVLEDALACFQNQFLTKGRRVQQEAQEAEAWFLSEDSHSPSSLSVPCSG